MLGGGGLLPLLVTDLGQVAAGDDAQASQKRTKRAIFSEASTSRVPASTSGWLATIPTGRPSKQAKPTTTLGANSSWTWTSSPWSTTAETTSTTS